MQHEKSQCPVPHADLNYLDTSDRFPPSLSLCPGGISSQSMTIHMHAPHFDRALCVPVVVQWCAAGDVTHAIAHTIASLSVICTSFEDQSSALMRASLARVVGGQILNVAQWTPSAPSTHPYKHLTALLCASKATCACCVAFCRKSDRFAPEIGFAPQVTEPVNY